MITMVRTPGWDGAPHSLSHSNTHPIHHVSGERPWDCCLLLIFLILELGLRMTPRGCAIFALHFVPNIPNDTVHHVPFSFMFESTRTFFSFLSWPTCNNYDSSVPGDFLSWFSRPTVRINIDGNEDLNGNISKWTNYRQNTSRLVLLAGTVVYANNVHQHSSYLYCHHIHSGLDSSNALDSILPISNNKGSSMRNTEFQPA